MDPNIPNNYMKAFDITVFIISRLYNHFQRYMGDNSHVYVT